MYTVEEKIQIIKWYYSGGSADEVVGRFVFEFPDRPIPTTQTVLNLARKFETHGCVTMCKKCCLTENMEVREREDRQERDVDICGFVESKGEEPCSSQDVSKETGVPASTVRRILKKNKYRCFKYQKAQEIFPEDRIRRMEFCEAMIEKANEDDNFLKNILFTDESSFPIHGRHNPSAVRYWSRKNKHLCITLRTQYPRKINVWAGILNDSIIGPFLSMVL